MGRRPQWQAAAGRGRWQRVLGRGPGGGGRLPRPKLLRGKRLVDPPYLVEGDALALPFRDGAFDVVLSVCAIEHFPDGAAALAEMARVLRPGGDLVLSADALTREQEWPELARKHRQRYAVRATYDVHRLQEMLEALGMTLLKHTYLFRSRSAEYLYLTLSARGGRYGWNAAAPVAPVMRFADARVPDESGSVLLVHARAAD